MIKTVCRVTCFHNGGYYFPNMTENENRYDTEGYDSQSTFLLYDGITTGVDKSWMEKLSTKRSFIAF
uniref:Uncharacterized protein n=1 Tax=Lepeophtheirus salmonis TaxID=72036 RepID=A0A0K2TMQ5_LEPSM